LGVTLRENRKVLIGDYIQIMVIKIDGKQVRLGFEAPPDVSVLREDEDISENG
jgi:carbon storage regulator CsrA